MATVQPAVCIEPRDYDLMRTQHAASPQFKILCQQSQHECVNLYKRLSVQPDLVNLHREGIPT